MYQATTDYSTYVQGLITVTFSITEENYFTTCRVFSNLILTFSPDKKICRSLVCKPTYIHYETTHIIYQYQLMKFPCINFGTPSTLEFQRQIGNDSYENH